MKHFMDELLDREYDLAEEVISLEVLFHAYGDYDSLEKKFSNNFLKWKYRNNYIDFDSFFEGTGLSNIVWRSSNLHHIDLDEYLFYCEFILNVINVMSHSVNNYIKDNVSNVLNKLNYKIHISEGKVHIIEDNVLVSEAAEIVSKNYDLGESIYSFNYRENKGNISKKVAVLCGLYKYIESISAKAKQFNLNGLLEDIKDLSNKLDVRHTTTEKQAEIIEDMGKAEYENWLDELYKMALSLIILVDYTEKRKDIKELKAKLG